MFIVNSIKKRFFSSESGSILIAALLVTTALALVMGAHSSRLVSEYRMSDRSYHMSAAMGLAEAGIQHAASELNYGDFATWTASNSGETQALTVASFTNASGVVCGGYTVTITDADTDAPSVVAVGFSPDMATPRSTKTIKVGLMRGEKGFFTMGVFGKESVVLNSNAVVDSYNSTFGAYGGTNISHSGNVGTNSTSESWPYAVTMNSNAQVYGDVVIGPGGDTDYAILENANVSITGAKETLDELKNFPDVYAPTLTYRGSIQLNANGSASITESGKYDFIRLNSNSHITVSGGDIQLHITGELSLNSNTRIDVEAGSSLELYVDSQMNFNSNAQINNLNTDPTKCILYGTSNYTGYLNFNSNTAFFGVVYAPEAHIQMNSNSGIYGSVAGKTVSICSNGQVHYDEALGESGAGPGTGDFNYTITSWAELNQ